jgi:hypothetical protein
MQLSLYNRMDEAVCSSHDREHTTCSYLESASGAARRRVIMVWFQRRGEGASHDFEKLNFKMIDFQIRMFTLYAAPAVSF